MGGPVVVQVVVVAAWVEGGAANGTKSPVGQSACLIKITRERAQHKAQQTGKSKLSRQQINYTTSQVWTHHLDFFFLPMYIVICH